MSNPFVAVLLVCVFGSAEAEWLKQSQDIMGTRVSVELWQQDASHARLCSDRVFAEMHRIDALMSPYKTESELSLINRQAAQQPVAVSPELYELIRRSLYFSEISAGAFDISFASIGYQYDYRRGLQPDRQTIEQALARINYRDIQLLNGTIHLAQPGMRIDLGGIAKGHAVDRAIAILSECGIRQALVSAGGDSRLLGDRQGRAWMIGIQHPRRPEALALSIPLENTAISTSGDYERFFLSDNERIHHIINPVTGRSAKLSWSATVIGPDATTTDALSTTIFILGTEEGLKLIDSLEHVDAIIIDASGVIHYSSGLIDPATPH